MKTKAYLSLSAIIVAVLPSHRAGAQGAAFTYQGRLNNGGLPAAGLYDFRFRLSSDSLGNGYIGNAYLTNGIAVSNGLFMTTVDFGVGVFTGTNYWLEIDVRTNGAAGYAALFPLQQFTTTPYAIFAGSAENVVGTVSASQLSGTATAATNFTGNLSGDVTGTQNATTVSFVGGEAAANVAAAVNAANAATSANTPSTIVKRDASGNFSAGNLNLGQTLNFTNDNVTPWTFNIFAGTFSDTIFVADHYGNVGLGDVAVVPSTNGSASLNTGLGTFALRYFTNGTGNTALGASALSSLNTGSYNIAIGYGAGVDGGSNNIDIGSFAGVENYTLRIGGSQTNTHIAGVYGTTLGAGTAVYINTDGRLGVLSSSQRYKQHIRPMGNASDVLLALQPVAFQYKPDIDAQGTPQFGLIAEQVEKIDPDLVLHDPEHGIYTVRYQAVDAMLLNEFLKQHKTIVEQNTAIQNLKQQSDSVEKRLDDLETAVRSMKK